MTVVDGRTHIGHSKNTPAVITGDDIISAMDRHDVDAAIVQPLPSASDQNDYEQEHERVRDLMERYPDRIFGLTCIPPIIGKEAYIEAAERYLDEGFVGLKYHPLWHGGSIQSKNARMVYEVADELETNVSIHTGIGIPWASPSLMIPVANRYPETTFVAVHSGAWMNSAEAAMVAAECENVILDTSWHYPKTVEQFLEQAGPDRIMMASDYPANLGMQRALWDSMDVSAETRSLPLGEVAIDTFGLDL